MTTEVSSYPLGYVPTNLFLERCLSGESQPVSQTSETQKLGCQSLCGGTDGLSLGQTSTPSMAGCQGCPAGSTMCILRQLSEIKALLGALLNLRLVPNTWFTSPFHPGTTRDITISNGAPYEFNQEKYPAIIPKPVHTVDAPPGWIQPEVSWPDKRPAGIWNAPNAVP